MATFEGIIIRTIDYQDNSKILYLYTPKGMLNMIARGVKKMQSPMRHLSQTGTIIDGDMSEGKFPTLRHATLVNHYPVIKQDWIKKTVMDVVFGLIYTNVTSIDNHQKLWPFILKFFTELTQTKHPLELMMVFELKLLNLLGIGINLKACEHCGETNDLVFDVSQSSLYCQAHAPSNKDQYSHAIYHPLQYYYYCDITEFKAFASPPATLNTQMKIVDALYQMHLSYKSHIKSLLKN